MDDLINFGEDDAAEAWFENELKQHIKVDFVGAVSWCLDVYYEWARTPD